MTSDDQHFLDILSSIPTDILHYSSSITNAFERNFDEASNTVRERLSTASWLPASIRPKPLPPPVTVVPFLNSHGYDGASLLWRTYARTVNWVNEHRALTAAVVAFAGTGGWLLYSRRRAYAKKRRAKRGLDGCRREVVVVSGSPSSPLPWSIVLDLERRGFIVYVLVNSSREEELVRNAGKVDILPLYINITDPLDIETQMASFTRLLSSPAPSLANTISSNETLTFTGLLLIPDLMYPSGPIETIPPSHWSDALNAKILHTIATTQAFLRPVCSFHSRILLLTPTIIPSLAPPFHGAETTIVAALSGFAATLRAELDTLDVPVAHLRLGTFDSAHLAGSYQVISQHSSFVRRDVMSWNQAQRDAYAQNYVQHSGHGAVAGLFGSRANASGASSKGGNGGLRAGGGVKGSPLRELHNAVFDALTQEKPRAVWRVGEGSVIYDVVGQWVPPGIVGWMMGVRKVVDAKVVPVE